MSNDDARYRQRVLATLDTMRTHEKDRLIIGLVDALYPNGDPDYSQDGADFIAEVILRIPAQSDRGFRSKVTVDSGPK